jgi:signal transduction histidine kinase
VNANEGNLDQVMMNLAFNAADAMPAGGELSIATAMVILDLEDCVGMHGARPGVYHCIAVSDSGIGMDHQTLQRIFEPFFTTKATGKGKGLGLAIVYGIVHQHGGWIQVCSAPGHGATFKVYLPACDEDGRPL